MNNEVQEAIQILTAEIEKTCQNMAVALCKKKKGNQAIYTFVQDNVYKCQYVAQLKEIKTMLETAGNLDKKQNRRKTNNNTTINQIKE